VPDVADELAVETDETEATVDAWLDLVSGSSTSIESTNDLLLLKRLAYRVRMLECIALCIGAHREPLDITFQAIHHCRPDRLLIWLALCNLRCDANRLCQVRTMR
jgi:hypothetical protein